MTFFERLINTVVTLSYVAFRDYYMMPQLEALLDEHFPEEVVGKRPSLLQLEKETGLAFQFGHPLLMDGLRPMAPNYVMIGTSTPILYSIQWTSVELSALHFRS